VWRRAGGAGCSKRRVSKAALVSCACGEAAAASARWLRRAHVPGRCSPSIEVTRLVSQLPNAWLNAEAPENVSAAARAAACVGEG